MTSDVNNHVEHLRSKHKLLDDQIHEESIRPQPDDILISSLKREKLKIKEEIEKLTS